jgi:hypothetical protein
VFVHGKPIHSRVKLEPSLGGTLKMCSTRVGSNLTHKFLANLERLAVDIHSSLFGFFMSDEEKSFITLNAGFNVIILLSLKCFAMVSF